MYDMLLLLGLTNFDIALIATCSFVSGCASLLGAGASEADLARLPPIEFVPASEVERKLKQPKHNVTQRSYRLMLTFACGIAIGAGIAFLFLGAIKPEPSAIGRIWLLALVFGFTTPRVLAFVRVRVDRTLQTTTSINDSRDIVGKSSVANSKNGPEQAMPTGWQDRVE